MITRILVLILIGTSFPAQSQTNNQTLDDCANAYFKGYNNNPEHIERKFLELKECIIGKPFPSFSATTITGKKYSNIDLQGKVVFISSWFTSCAPCVAEIPMLNDLNKEFGDKGFLLLSFSTDNVIDINEFIAKRPISYAIFPNAKELIEQRLRTTYGYPTNIILNKRREIVDFRNGGPVDEIGLEKVKKEFLEIIKTELNR